MERLGKWVEVIRERRAKGIGNPFPFLSCSALASNFLPFPRLCMRCMKNIGRATVRERETGEGKMSYSLLHSLLSFPRTPHFFSPSHAVVFRGLVLLPPHKTESGILTCFCDGGMPLGASVQLGVFPACDCRRSLRAFTCTYCACWTSNPLTTENKECPYRTLADSHYLQLQCHQPLQMNILPLLPDNLLLPDENKNFTNEQCSI